ncbi:MAG: thiamine protein [Flavisolibacter sp.]|jgi:molybdopterin synthase sulfur carrier subunit|nr:thiamine protein [Flavisolibacter sp.]
MTTRIIVFGQLTDIINSSELALDNIRDTDSVVEELNNRYPALVSAKYMIAVDKQTVTENTILKEGSTVALLPPFSGG